MAKDATLGSNLVDKLIPVVDKIRTSIFAKMGVRQFRVFLVRRHWSGGARGEGTPTYVSEVEITPSPKVLVDGKPYEHLPGGLGEVERITLAEVSLRFAEHELTGLPIVEDEEFYYRVIEGHGQQIPTRFFQLDGIPEARRTQGMGWRIDLRQVEIQE